MDNCWQLLKKELAVLGVSLVDDQRCKLRQDDGSFKTCSLAKAIKTYNKKIEKNGKMLCFLWRKAVDLASQECEPLNDISSVDARSRELFIFSLKDMAKFIDAFEDLDGSNLKKVVIGYLGKDINEFDRKQINLFPNFKMAIDVTFRKINKMCYTIDLLRFASNGEVHANAYEIKMAKGISGPWAHLDLPMLERVWPWADEDENLRGRSSDIRKQRRYRMGLENYNAPGVNEGFYWRELRNEPFSWYNKSDEDPYYQRYLLTRSA